MFTQKPNTVPITELSLHGVAAAVNSRFACPESKSYNQLERYKTDDDGIGTSMATGPVEDRLARLLLSPALRVFKDNVTAGMKEKDEGSLFIDANNPHHFGIVSDAIFDMVEVGEIEGWINKAAVSRGLPRDTHGSATRNHIIQHEFLSNLTDKTQKGTYKPEDPSDVAGWRSCLQPEEIRNTFGLPTDGK